MSSFVKLAILLGKANVLEIIDDRYVDYEEYKEKDIVIRLNNQEYVVADVASTDGKVDDDGIVIDKHYNKAFYDSINNSDRPRIDHVQNGEVLFDAAYKLLRFLSIECRENVTDTTQSAVIIKEEINALCEEWLPGNAFHSKIDLAQGAYEEMFDCRLKYAKSTGELGSIQIGFRYQRPLLSSGSDPRKDSDEVSTTPILLDISADKSNFGKWRKSSDHIVPKAQATDYNDPYNKPAFEVVMAHLQGLLDHAVTGGFFKHKKKIDDLSQINVEAVKYYKIHKWQATVEASINKGKNLLSVEHNFKAGDLFVYDNTVIPAMEHSVNILKCPTPTCTKYVTTYLAPENTFGFYADPNWQIEYIPKTDIKDPAAKGSWYRHAVGCSVCMSERCEICGQAYYPYARINEIKDFYHYTANPTKAFLDNDVGVNARLKSGKDRISHYCGCMKDLFWFYDNAYATLNGDPQRGMDRALRNKDMVFINDLTKEVVAAYSPVSYQAALKEATEIFLTGEDGKKEDAEWANNMTAGKIKVFFSDFVEKRCSDSSNVGQFRSYMKGLLPKDGTSFMDVLDAEHLAAFFKAKNITTDKAKDEFLKKMKDEVNDLLSRFKTRLSKFSSMDGKDGHILDTSVYSCSLCKICGSLYFIETEPNDAVTPLPREHKADDACDIDNKGRWTTIRGAVLYKDRKNHSRHITSRYVMTSKKEVSFEDWQKGLVSSIIK